MAKGERGQGYVFQRGQTWWVQFRFKAKRFRESSKSTKRSVAVKLLNQRLRELGAGRPACEARKVTLADLKALIFGDYKLNGRASVTRLEQSWARFVSFFGEKASVVDDITTPQLHRYVAQRTEVDGVKPSTARTELAALHRAFVLAQKTGVLLANECPSFPTIVASRPREGFFEHEDLVALCAALPPDLADLATFLYWSGWRRGEAQGLLWSNVDLKKGVIRIEETKNKEPRTLPYHALPVLADLIQRRHGKTDAAQKKRHKLIPYVFHRNGEPIRWWRGSWISACVAAGLGKEVKDENGKVVKRIAYRIPHDFRRSCVRNLERAGVSRSVAMKITGHKTETIYKRYAIVSEADIAAGLAKVATPAAKPRKVTRMKTRRVG